MSNKDDIFLKILSAAIVVTLVGLGIFFWKKNIVDFLKTLPGPYGKYFATLLREEEPPTIKIDGKVLSFGEQKPVMKKGITLVPARDIFQALGASVSWDEPSKTVTAVKGDTTVKFTVNSSTAYKNDAPIQLDAKPQFIKDRSMVPLRTACEALGNIISYDGATNTVHIESQEMQKRLSSALANKQTFRGEAGENGRSVTWPFKLTITSYEQSSGKLTGQIEWTTLNSVNKIEGTLSGAKMTFKESEYIRKGSAILGSVYTLYPDVGMKMRGNWENNGRRGPAWFSIE